MLFRSGNKNPTKEEKAAIRLKSPGYADSWYQNQLRNMRKQRTVDYFNKKYNLSLTDFDVADSFGIAHYSNSILTERSSYIKVKIGYIEDM